MKFIPLIKSYWQLWQAKSFSLRLTAYLLIFALGFIVLLPVAVEKIAEKLLLDQGAEIAEIEDVDINLFTAQASVTGLQVQFPDAQPLSLKQFDFDFSWSGLFKKRLLIENLAIYQANVEVSLMDKQINIGGYEVPLSAEAQAETDQDKKPFDWGLGIQSLSLVDSKLRLQIVGLDKRIAFHKVTIYDFQNWSPDDPANLSFTIDIGEGHFNGDFKVRLFSKAQQAEGTLSFDEVYLQDYSVVIGKQLQVAKADIDGDLSVTVAHQQGKVTADSRGFLQLKQVELQHQKDTLQLAKLHWENQLQASYQAGKLGLQLTKQQLDIDELKLIRPDQQLSFKQLQLSGKVSVDQQPDTIKIAATPLMQLTELQLTSEQPQQSFDIHLAKASYQGQVSVNQLAEGLTVDLQKMQTKTEAFQLVLDKGLQVQLQASDTTTDVQLAMLQDQEMQLSAEGQTILDKLDVSHPQQQIQIAAFDQLTTGFQFKAPQAVSLTEFRLDQLLFAKRDEDQHPMVQLGAIKLSALAFEQQKLAIEQLGLDHLKVEVAVDPDKKIPPLEAVMAALPQADESATESSPKPSSAQPPFQVRLAELKMTGENVIDVTTLATKPKMDKRLLIQKLEVKNLDSQKPKQNTTISFKAKVDKYTNVALDGYAQPFNEQVNADIKAKIDDLDLYSFSPLIKRDLGYRIQSGSLNLKSQTKIKDNLMESNNKVALIGFEMEAEEPTKAEKEQKKQAKEEDKGRPISPWTLKLGLEMLRDSRGKIDLDLPVKGDLNDPGFDAGSAVNVALKNTLTAGTKVALAMALQPFGAIAVASHYAYGQASKITFEPVVFEAGLDKMASSMSDYLNKLSKVLKEKESITLKVCGYYTEQDRKLLAAKGLAAEKLNNELYQLAKQRQQLVKDTLIEKGISASRMTTCHPGEKDDKITGVTLSM